MQEEFAALGADFAARRAVTAASVEAIRLAFTGEPVHARTEWWQADGNSLEPAPDPPLPIWLGGNSRWAIEQAARSCDGWSPHEVTEDASRRLGTVSVASVDDLRGRLAILRELIDEQRAGEPFDVCLVRGHAASWRSRPDDAILEQLYAFRDLGVTWIALRFEAATTPELVDEIGWFGALAAPLRAPSAARGA
jgi:alkanesulfonate monooxygenase SsuD/methylene tetrahydromethanopterin reductase-like flavin-dependent oxidoreductase (luciferase family)